MEMSYIHWLLKHWYCNCILSVCRFVIDGNVIYTLISKTLISQLNIKWLTVCNGCECHIYTDFKRWYCNKISIVCGFVMDVNAIYTLTIKTLIFQLNIKCLPVCNGCECHIYTDF